MRIRHILFGALAASVALASAASASQNTTSVPPPVGRIAKELAGGGAQRVIVVGSVGDKSYVATAGTRRPKADQRFRVGSVTKTFTATIVLELVEERKLALSSSNGNYDVYVTNADGSGQTNVTRSRASESGFAWSPRRTR